MKKRNLGIMILLTFVTLGIYTMVWIYKSRKEVTTILQNDKAIKPFIWLLAPLLILIALFFIIFLVNFISNSDSNTVGTVVTAFGFLAVLGTFAIPFWWFVGYFKAVHAATGGNDFSLLYGIWVISFLVGVPIWILLVQNDLNKKIDQLNGVTPVGMPGAPTPPAGLS